MARRLTTEVFIERSNIRHNSVYDYSKSVYVNRRINVVITCKMHGNFTQSPYIHMNGSGCPKCYYNKITYKNTSNTNDFIKKSKEIHGDKYDYSNVDYVHSKKNVKIICLEHGKFKQSPSAHLTGQGCKICGYLTSSELRKKSREEFIVKSKEIHGDKYDYDKIVYFNNKNKINIICDKHGVFEQSPAAHLKGSGCKKCSNEHKSKLKIKSQAKFIDEAKNIHGNYYDYSKVIYVHSKQKIIITCKKHGDFKQKPNHHLIGQGCPICKESNGEKK